MWLFMYLGEAISMADRVVILSKRPGEIKKLVPIQLTCEDKNPTNARHAPEFPEYFNMLWKEINDESA